MADKPRYRCRNCGNDAKFRARAKLIADSITVDGYGNIINLDPESYIIDEKSPPEVLEVTDCLSCGGVSIEDFEQEKGSNG